MTFIKESNPLSILNINHKASDCLLLVAFALTEEQFILELETTCQKEYAKLQAKEYKLLPKYLYKINHLPLVKTILDVIKKVEDLGVTVVQYTRLKDLQDISKFKVVTIVAHFNNSSQQIELSDKLHSMDNLVDNIDNHFCGIMDLSVCNSIILQDKIKTRFDDKIYVKANKELAEIKIHLILYKKVIELLSKSEMNYLSATMQLRIDLNNYIKSK